jgi:hypothetical protein
MVEGPHELQMTHDSSSRRGDDERKKSLFDPEYIFCNRIRCSELILETEGSGTTLDQHVILMLF